MWWQLNLFFKNPFPSFQGHSMGGRVGMILALTQPQFLNKLICVDSTPVNSPVGMERWKTLGEACRLLRDMEPELRRETGVSRFNNTNKFLDTLTLVFSAFQIDTGRQAGQTNFTKSVRPQRILGKSNGHERERSECRTALAYQHWCHHQQPTTDERISSVQRRPVQRSSSVYSWRKIEIPEEGTRVRNLQAVSQCKGRHPSRLWPLAPFRAPQGVHASHCPIFGGTLSMHIQIHPFLFFIFSYVLLLLAFSFSTCSCDKTGLNWISWTKFGKYTYFFII